MLLQDITQPVLFFDGECNLCNSAVQFVIHHDRKKQFLFAPLQSAAGAQLRELMHGNIPDSVVLYHKGSYSVRSLAALYTARLLGAPWSLFYGFIFVPRFMRDAIYNLIARNRYKWFGKQDICMVPTKELQARFI